MTAIGPRGPSLPVACAVSPRGPCRELCSFALGGSHSIWLPRPCQCLCGVDLRSCSVLSLSFPPGTEGRLPSPAPLAPPPPRPPGRGSVGYFTCPFSPDTRILSSLAVSSLVRWTQLATGRRPERYGRKCQWARPAYAFPRKAVGRSVTWPHPRSIALTPPSPPHPRDPTVTPVQLCAGGCWGADRRELVPADRRVGGAAASLSVWTRVRPGARARARARVQASAPSGQQPPTRRFLFPPRPVAGGAAHPAARGECSERTLRGTPGL